MLDDRASQLVSILNVQSSWMFLTSSVICPGLLAASEQLALPNESSVSGACDRFSAVVCPNELKFRNPEVLDKFGYPGYDQFSHFMQPCAFTTTLNHGNLHNNIFLESS